MKTVDLLDAVKARHNIPSDYAAAKFLGLTQAQVSRYRTGRDTFGDSVAVKIAGLLDLPAEYVLACIHAERTSDAEVSKIWTDLAGKLKKASTVTAALAFMMFFSGGPDGGAMAATRDQAETYSPNSVYYVNSSGDVRRTLVHAQRQPPVLHELTVRSFGIPPLRPW